MAEFTCMDRSIELPPYTPSLTWLFNITADPNERNNVAHRILEVWDTLDGLTFLTMYYYSYTAIYL